MRETWVQSLGLVDLLEKGKVTPPVFWFREFQRLYDLWGHKESDTTEWLSLHSALHISIFHEAFLTISVYMYVYIHIKLLHI